ncbi:MAG: peptidoglycan DD-metalloendopeptidase family protein [Saprospiraceae bacterium]|nr:peptidoglycan DD-metalloendopeptidase family protein [Saprospiraceae bacterium]
MNRKTSQHLHQYVLCALWFILIVCIHIGCSDEEVVIPIPSENNFDQSFPIVYNAVLPNQKLPYPHHNPENNQFQYDSLVQELFIINNFGLYQCGETKETCYFHDGLDFVLPNSTPIFALKSGTVRANIGGNQYYRTLVVEDEDQPGYAWSYTHVNDFGVKLGEEVTQGQFLARVKFSGLEHIHLNRTRLRDGGSWDKFEDLVNIYPDDYFTFIDDTPPIIKKPFYFFKNHTDSLLMNEEGMDTIHGQVDLVVSMRDGGAYASDYIANSGYWGDRLAIKSVGYRILKDSVEVANKPSFDFTKLEFRFHNEKWRETMTVFKHADLLDIDAGSNNMFHSHYILTHARDNLTGAIHPDDSSLSWNTLEMNNDGSKRFPNGRYTIEVTAYDSNNNKTVETDDVYILNK